MGTKQKRKKLLLAVTAVVLVAALGAGIWFGTRSGGEPVNVYPFQYLGMTEFWGDNQESYGPVTTDKIQTVFLTDTQTVTEVLVKDGDEVKKGDILLSFDTTLDSLSLERKRLEVEKIKVQIKAAGERLEETYDMVPYVPPVIPEKEEDLGEELKEKTYQISENAVYDGSKPEKYLICWLQNGTPITDAVLQELYETSLEYRKKNLEEEQKKEQEQKETASASALPEPLTENQTEQEEKKEKTFSVPGFFTCNGQTVEPDDMTVGAAEYTISNTYTYQEKTYWLESAIRKSDNASVENLKIPAYPQTDTEQEAWEAEWKDGVEVKYMRNVSMTAEQMQEGSFTTLEKDSLVQLEIGKEALLLFRPQIENPPEDITLEFVIAPEDGILNSAYEDNLLILTGKPEELTTQPVDYSVTAKYTFYNNDEEHRAIEETFSFSLSVVQEPKVKKGEFYVVFKSTNKNLLKAPQTLWEGAHVFVYDDGSFGILPFDASALTDHTLPPEEELEIVLPEIDPNAIYTAEEILEMQKQLNQTIKEQKEKLVLAEAEYKIMERELGDGNIYADIDGQVVSLLPEEEAKQNKQPMLKVSGGGGFYIEGSVSELEKEKLKPGQEVTVNDWNTGNVYTGEVISIGDFPTDNDNWNGMGNPNASYYPFRAFVDGEADLQEGSYVSMSYSTASAEQGIYLEKAFVRTEKGESYIYAMGSDGRLEKRTVRVGKVLWGSYYEILSGISEEDLLAFPYGKHVKHGAPAVESDISTLYTY